MKYVHVFGKVPNLPLDTFPALLHVVLQFNMSVCGMKWGACRAVAGLQTCSCNASSRSIILLASVRPNVHPEFLRSETDNANRRGRICGRRIIVNRMQPTVQAMAPYWKMIAPVSRVVFLSC
jgi:hypothetical protein